MHRVPDDIPRLAGIINADHTTPLSHTNVLATGRQIPNAIQIGAFDLVERERLDGGWVVYRVDAADAEIGLSLVDEPSELDQRPAWYAQRITLEEPEANYSPIAGLGELRHHDRHRYGTKAANLGELHHVLAGGSRRLLGFFPVPRPPRENLLPHLVRLLDVPEDADLTLGPPASSWPTASACRGASRCRSRSSSGSWSRHRAPSRPSAR